MRNTLVEVSKKFFFTDDLGIFGLSGAGDNVGDDTISKPFVVLALPEGFVRIKCV